MTAVKLPFYARLALILLAIMLIIIFLMKGDGIFIPLVFALLISILLLPFARLLEKRLHLGRAPAAMLSILLFIGCIAAFCYFMTVQVANFSQDLPELQKRVHDMIGNTQHWITRKYHVNTKQQTDYINKSTNSIIGTAANSLGNVFISLGTITLWTIFVFIYTFFMLFHRRLLVRFVLHLFKPNHRDEVSEVINETRTMMNSYVLGLLLEMGILGVLTCSVFLIMGVKYALLLGVMAAVLNIVPYIGIYTAAALAMLVTFANNGGNAALEVMIAFIVIHLVDSNVLMPRIVGSRVKMNPLITIIAVIVGELIWGLPGMFLFIPLTGMFKLICERVEGMQAWAILIGTEDKPKRSQR